METTAVRGARSRVGEPVAMEVGADAVVVDSARGRQVYGRRRRPVVVTNVAKPRMDLRPGFRLPVDATRARAFWFDDEHARHLALVALERHGWRIRPRRWPLVVGAVVMAAIGVASAGAGEWLLAAFAAAGVGGCVLHSTRNERAVRRVGIP